jgi:hypothetical protein
VDARDVSTAVEERRSHAPIGIRTPDHRTCSYSIKSAVFWGVTRRRVVIVYRRFGTTYLSRSSRVKSPSSRLLTREDGIDTLSRIVSK